MEKSSLGISLLNQIAFWDSKERKAVLIVEEFEARRLVVEFSKWALLEETLRKNRGDAFLQGVL